MLLLLLLLLIMIIMNMQNKLYTIQFSYHPMTGSHLVPKQRLQILERADFAIFMKFPKKTKLLEKFREEGMRTHRKEKKIAAPQPTTVYKLSMKSMVWNISIGQLGLAVPGSSPSQLLHTSSLAEYGRQENVLDFLVTTENISVISILLVLNPKHSSYWEENLFYPI